MCKIQIHNEAVINTQVESIMAINTYIKFLDKINPKVITASGRMNKQNETRIFLMENYDKRGTLAKKLAEMVHEIKLFGKLKITVCECGEY